MAKDNSNDSKQVKVRCADCGKKLTITLRNGIPTIVTCPDCGMTDKVELHWKVIDEDDFEEKEIEVECIDCKHSFKIKVSPKRQYFFHCPRCSTTNVWEDFKPKSDDDDDVYDNY